jgi:hypothetical protein
MKMKILLLCMLFFIIHTAEKQVFANGLVVKAIGGYFNGRNYCSNWNRGWLLISIVEGVEYSPIKLILIEILRNKEAKRYFFFFCDAGDGTQRLAHARQALYNWAPSPAPSRYLKSPTWWNLTRSTESKVSNRWEGLYFLLCRTLDYFINLGW